MSERERRAGLNEAMFREVNERVHDLNQTFTTSAEGLDLVCECADTGCAAYLRMEPGAYEALRAAPRRFVVVPGHQLTPDIERVVERQGGYVVVEKLGDAAEAAEQTDPRAADSD